MDVHPWAAAEREPAENSPYRRIVRAAEVAFVRSGFRGVTMEALAREASVAKATLYAQFRNKEEVFIAVCGRMARANTRVFLEKLTGPGDLDHRIARSIVAKHRRVLTLVRTSPHAQDILAHTARLAADIFADEERTLLEHLASALATDARLAAEAEELARALYFGGRGLAEQLTTAGQLEAELSAFVHALLAGARTLAVDVTI